MIFSTAVLVLFGIEALIILVCLFSERPSLAFISFVVAMLVAQFGFDFNVLTPIWANVPFAAGVFAGYLPLGGAHSVLRWYARMNRTSEKLAVVEDKFLKARDADIEKMVEGFAHRHAAECADVVIEDYDPPEFDEDAAREKARDIANDHNNYEGERLFARMKLSQHKTLIVGWITFWPIDILVLLFEEPVQLIWERLSTTYQRIARQALARHGLTETYGEKLDQD